MKNDKVMFVGKNFDFEIFDGNLHILHVINCLKLVI